MYRNIKMVKLILMNQESEKILETLNLSYLQEA